jgi:hypothetical protein
VQSRASHSLDTRFRNDTERVFRRQESIAAPGMTVARNMVGRFESANRVDRYGGLKNLVVSGRQGSAMVNSWRIPTSQQASVALAHFSSGTSL